MATNPGRHTEAGREMALLAHAVATSKQTFDEGYTKSKAKPQLEGARKDIAALPVPPDDGVSVPGAPVAVTVSADMRSVAVNWEAPPAEDHVRRSVVRVTPEGLDPEADGVLHEAATVGLTVFGLDARNADGSPRSYTFEVAHVNHWGRGGPWSAPLQATPEENAADAVDLGRARIFGELGWPNIAPLREGDGFTVEDARGKLGDQVVTARAMAAQDAALFNLWAGLAMIESAHIKEIAADKIAAGTLTVAISLSTGGRVVLTGSGRIEAGSTVMDSSGYRMAPASQGRAAPADLVGRAITVNEPDNFAALWWFRDNTTIQRGASLRADGVPGGGSTGALNLIATAGGQTDPDALGFAWLEVHSDTRLAFMNNRVGVRVRRHLAVVGTAQVTEGILVSSRADGAPTGSVEAGVLSTGAGGSVSSTFYNPGGGLARFGGELRAEGSLRLYGQLYNQGARIDASAYTAITSVAAGASEAIPHPLGTDPLWVEVRWRLPGGAWRPANGANSTQGVAVVSWGAAAVNVSNNITTSRVEVQALVWR